MSEKNSYLEKEILNSVRESINKSIVDSLTGYNGPLTKCCNSVLNNHQDKIAKLINDELISLLDSETFKKSLTEVLNKKLAQVLVSRLSGDLESRINNLRANPETRAKITLQITKVVDDMFFKTLKENGID